MADILKKCRFAAFLESLGKRLKNDGMMRDGVFMVFVVFLSQVFTYVYLLVMGISLDAGDYSILYSLNSLLTTITIAPLVFNYTVSWFTSKISGNENGHTLSLVRFFGRTGLILSIISFILIYLLSPFVAHYLDIENPLQVTLIFLTVAIGFPQAAFGGMLNGLRKFKYQGVVQVLQGFSLLFLGFVFVYAGLGIYGGLLAFPLSSAITAMVSFYLIHRLRGGKKELPPKTGLISYAVYTLLSLLAVTVITNMDVIFAKHYLNIDNAGNYAAIALLGKVALYAPTGIATAMFPKTAALYQNGGNHRRILFTALSIVVILSASILVCYSLFAGLFTRIVFGGKYPLLLSYLPEYTIAMSLFGITFVNIRYFLSVNETLVSYYLLLAMVVQIILTLPFHDSIASLVNDTLITGVACILLMCWFHLGLMKKETARLLALDKKQSVVGG